MSGNEGGSRANVDWGSMGCNEGRVRISEGGDMGGERIDIMRYAEWRGDSVEKVMGSEPWVARCGAVCGLGDVMCGRMGQ